jgi:hypothetical protein
MMAKKYNMKEGNQQRVDKKNNNFKINHRNYENAINVGFYQKGRKAREIYADKH